MPVAVPSVLAPYLQSLFSGNSLSLLTSVLQTPCSWLIPWCISTALHGIDADVQFDSRVSATDSKTAGLTTVTFLSIVRPYDLWVELGRKSGLDLALLLQQKRLIYIDGLTGILVGQQSTIRALHPQSHSLQDLSLALDKAKPSTSQDTASEQKSVLIIDGLDFILASQPDTSNLQLNAFITSLRTKFSDVIVTAAADAPLLHNIDASATPLEIEHSILVRALAHQSNWVLQLRPLETGHAKDVTGVIQISKGGSNVADDSSLLENEWLYQVKSDGNVKVWGRGE